MIVQTMSVIGLVTRCTQKFMLHDAGTVTSRNHTVLPDHSLHHNFVVGETSILSRLSWMQIEYKSEGVMSNFFFSNTSFLMLFT